MQSLNAFKARLETRTRLPPRAVDPAEGGLHTFHIGNRDILKIIGGDLTPSVIYVTNVNNGIMAIMSGST